MSWDRFETVSLVVAVVVVLVALYRYLLTTWRSNVDLRSYPFLIPMTQRKVGGKLNLQVDSPDEQQVKLELLDKNDTSVRTLHEGILVLGVHSFELDSGELDNGSYFIRLTSKGQVDTRRIEVENL